MASTHSKVTRAHLGRAAVQVASEFVADAVEEFAPTFEKHGGPLTERELVLVLAAVNASSAFISATDDLGRKALELAEKFAEAGQ